jgi:hypothetical protein
MDFQTLFLTQGLFRGCGSVFPDFLYCGTGAGRERNARPAHKALRRRCTAAGILGSIPEDTMAGSKWLVAGALCALSACVNHKTDHETARMQIAPAGKLRVGIIVGPNASPFSATTVQLRHNTGA